jgi:hypothetical protein
MSQGHAVQRERAAQHTTSSDIFKYEKAANHGSVEYYERQGASPNCRLRNSLSRHSKNMHV